MPQHPWQEKPDIAALKRRIARAKRAIKADVRKRGMRENLGVDAARRILDDFGIHQFDPQVRRLIVEFEEWCANYTPY